MIRVAIVDDHPALRAGLEAVLRGEPGIVPVGSAGGLAEAEALLNRARPDVVILDYHLPEEDGLVACRRIKQRLVAPHVLLYTAYAGSELAIPARLAGADGILSKGVAARELFDALRRVVRGERIGPAPTDELVARARERVDPRAVPLLDGLLEGRSLNEVAQEAGVSPDDVGPLVDGMLATLRVAVPTVQA